MSELQELALRIVQCTDCPFSKGRTHVVPGEGNEQAEVMFIGEGPGYHEDLQGRPFVGPAGKFLDSLLASMSLDRQIELINPKLIVTLGRHSLAKFFPKEAVSKVRGKTRSWNGRTFYPLLHPASALYRQELRQVIEQDFQAIPGLLKAHRPVVQPQEERPQELSLL
ncbi:MAG: uracil-DNA glycosylase [Dehalococcoidia bacterium]|nr:uracil-DNA glycosylase [Dehalococcoidia bacterium]